MTQKSEFRSFDIAICDESEMIMVWTVDEDGKSGVDIIVVLKCR